MKTESCELAGVRILRGELHADERGDLRKVVSEAVLDEIPALAWVTEVLTTFNEEAGTVRGLHYQVAPRPQSKTVWVSRGAIRDFLVDLRATEPTYGLWMSVDLTDEEPVALHIPPGIAHGYQTMADHTQLTYLVNGGFSADHARTLQWDDPTVGVPWPLPVTRMSSSDRHGSPWPPAS